MRASKYFPDSQLLSLEFALFNDMVHDNTKYQYCLINESTKSFYVSESVSVASIIARLRLLVKGAEYSLLAHQVQNSAYVSQMVDWILAVFKPGQDYSAICDTMFRQGFTQYLREKPYGVNSIDNIAMYCATHDKKGFKFYFTSVKDVKPADMMRAARGYLQRAADKMANEGTPEAMRVSVEIDRIKAHSYAKEWTIKPASLGNCITLSDIRKHTASANAKALYHFVEIFSSRNKQSVT